MDCSPPGSSVHGLLQSEHWGGLLGPPPGIFLTQGLTACLLHRMQILYHLSHQGSSVKRNDETSKWQFFWFAVNSWGTHLSSFFTFLICFKCWMTIGWLTLNSSAVTCAVSRDQLRWLLSIGHRQLLVAGHCTLIFIGLISCKSSWITTELSVC